MTAFAPGLPILKKLTAMYVGMAGGTSRRGCDVLHGFPAIVRCRMTPGASGPGVPPAQEEGPHVSVFVGINTERGDVGGMADRAIAQGDLCIELTAVRIEMAIPARRCGASEKTHVGIVSHMAPDAGDGLMASLQRIAIRMIGHADGRWPEAFYNVAV